jgi:hypothetical protein
MKNNNHLLLSYRTTAAIISSTDFNSLTVTVDDVEEELESHFTKFSLYHIAYVF